MNRCDRASCTDLTDHILNAARIGPPSFASAAAGENDGGKILQKIAWH